MALFDLFENARKTAGVAVSLVALIDEFLYREQLALQSGELTEPQVRMQEAKIEVALAKRKLSEWKLRHENGDTHDRKKYFHPSSLGKCERAIVYSFNSAPEEGMTDSSRNIPAMGTTLRIFSTGNYFHLRMGVLMVRMGLATVDDIEVPFQNGDRQGTCDAVVTIKGKKYIVDFKSIKELGQPCSKCGNTPFGYDKWGWGAINPAQPDPGYESQIRMYMSELRKKYKIAGGILLYENKNTSEMKEVFFKWQKQKTRRVLGRLSFLRDIVKRRALPERPYQSPTRIPCKNCPFNSLCWDDKATNKWLKSVKGSHI